MNVSRGFCCETNNTANKNPFEEDRKAIMAATREDAIEFLKNMTLLEASQLVKELEETFGVSAAAAAVAAPQVERLQPAKRRRQQKRKLNLTLFSRLLAETRSTSSKSCGKLLRSA